MPHPLQVKVYSPEELSVYSQNDDVTEQKAVLIGSRIRERDKSNAEYYVGVPEYENETKRTRTNMLETTISDMLTV